MNKVIYKPAARISHYKGHVSFYPVIKFYSNCVSDEFWLNEPENTRSKAIAAAKRYIKKQ